MTRLRPAPLVDFLPTHWLVFRQAATGTDSKPIAVQITPVSAYLKRGEGALLYDYKLTIEDYPVFGTDLLQDGDFVVWDGLAGGESPVGHVVRDYDKRQAYCYIGSVA